MLPGNIVYHYSVGRIMNKILSIQLIIWHTDIRGKLYLAKIVKKPIYEFKGGN